MILSDVGLWKTTVIQPTST